MMVPKESTDAKRVSVCDRGGNFLDAIVLPANLGERVCALALLLQVKHKPWWREVEVVYADSSFAGEGFARHIEQQCGVRLDIVKRTQGKGFDVLPNRWLIEQVFGCQGRYCRTSRDYEQSPRNAPRCQHSQVVAKTQTRSHRRNPLPLQETKNLMTTDSYIFYKFRIQRQYLFAQIQRESR